MSSCFVASFYRYFYIKISPCSVKEVPDALINFYFSPRYHPSAYPPKLHIHHNLSLYTTGSPPNPRSTGMHYKRAYKIRNHRFKQPHRVGCL